ncbi:sulfotransferase [Jatrophihabitans sp.]|uniref:sulfotransferase n=1 Tax=Jatrophihabitans sp. TaxID=1932789 RepID=UPI002CDFFF07|nr:sulfotransferase [Jatrophihabitans sp.]
MTDPAAQASATVHPEQKNPERENPEQENPGPENSELTVLCITGWCRNGSTILGNVLNEVPGFFHVGEIHFLWKNSSGLGVNNLCGCGATLPECPVWSQILPVGRPAGMTPAEHARNVIRRQRSSARTRHTWRIMRNGLNSTDSTDLKEHAELMAGVYRAVAAQTGSRVLVDTTKIPGEAAVLPRLPGIRTVFVHLVRDPMAVSNSWRTPKDYVYTMSAGKNTAYWRAFNIASRAILRHYPEQSMLLRYEDFIADPAGTVDTLLRMCGADPAGNPVHGQAVTLHTNHTVTGNPDRFRHGETVIRPKDESWRKGLPLLARLSTAVVAWPMAWRYGYRTTGGLRVPAHPLRPATVPAAPAAEPALEDGTVGSGT